MSKLLDLFNDNNIDDITCDNYGGVKEGCAECKIKKLCDTFTSLRESIYQLHEYMVSKEGKKNRNG